MPNAARSARARRRAWPVVARPLHEEDSLQADESTPEQRLAIMWELAVEGWALAGKNLPDYDRAHTPVRVVRRRRR